MSTAREAILGGVRRQLERAAAGERLQDESRHPPVPPGFETPALRRERFQAVLEGIGGHVWPVRDESEAAARFATLCTDLGARRIVSSDAQLVQAVLDARPVTAAELEILPWSAARDDLLEADLGFTGAQRGIAETGTLVLASAHEQNRLASLVPPVHVAILRSSAIVGTLGEALGSLSSGPGPPASRAITLITGPSRTADIELTLVVGVHGPKALHVILLEDLP